MVYLLEGINVYIPLKDLSSSTISLRQRTPVASFLYAYIHSQLLFITFIKLVFSVLLYVKSIYVRNYILEQYLSFNYYPSGLLLIGSPVNY